MDRTQRSALLRRYVAQGMSKRDALAKVNSMDSNSRNSSRRTSTRRTSNTSSRARRSALLRRYVAQGMSKSEALRRVNRQRATTAQRTYIPTSQELQQRYIQNQFNQIQQNQAELTQNNQANIDAALEHINNSDLDEGTKAYFREVVRAWDPNMEVNIPNVLKTFNKIKETTISPYFAEKAKIFTDELLRNKDYLEKNRALEVEQEQEQYQSNLDNARANLEARGLTFSGEAGKILGSKAANYGEQQSPIFKKFGEGAIDKQNRLMTTSSTYRFKKNLKDLQRNAEQVLGSEGSKNLNFGGVQQLGGLKGSMVREENQANADTLTRLYNQEMNNVEARQPMRIFN